MSLSDSQRERYARQMTAPGWGAEGQSRLGASRVFVAGTGGLGCAASLYLAAMGVGKITLCDHDRVERSNLNRQILFTEKDIGKEKAPLAAARLKELNPTVEIEPVSARIDETTARDLLADADLALDCLDNLETRFVLNRAAIGERVPLIHAAVSEFTGYLSFLDPPRTPCLACFLPARPTPAPPAVPGCTPGVLGTLQAMEAVKFLTGVGENLAGRLLIIEGTEPRFEIVQLERDPDCPDCRDLERKRSV